MLAVKFDGNAGGSGSWQCSAGRLRAVRRRDIEESIAVLSGGEFVLGVITMRTGLGVEGLEALVELMPEPCARCGEKMSMTVVGPTPFTGTERREEITNLIHRV